MRWLDTHRDLFIDLVRIYLGIGLLIMGVHFVVHQASLLSLMEASNLPAASVALTHYIAMAHMGGGLLMAIGLCTRLAALCQVPILFGAVFLVHGPGGLFTSAQTLEFSALVLVLLVLFSLFGAGRLSVDHYVFRDGVEPVQAG